MKIVLHSGSAIGLLRSVQGALAQARVGLLAAGVLYPDALGGQDQSDLFLASIPLIDPHPVAAARGLSDPVDLQDFSQRTRTILAAQIIKARPKVLILSLPDPVMWCDRPEALLAFRAMLAEFAEDILTVLHLAAPSDALADMICAQALLGRCDGLAAEKAVSAAAGWWDGAIAARAGKPAGSGASHLLVQTASPAVDPDGVVRLWQQVFGADSVLAREFAAGAGSEADIAVALADLGLPDGVVAGTNIATHSRPSIATLRRMFTLNAALAAVEKTAGAIPQTVRAALVARFADEGKGLTGHDVSALTQAIRTDKDARKTVPDLSPDPAFDPAPLLDGIAEQAANARIAAAAARNTRLVAQGATATAAVTAAPARKKGPEPLSEAGEVILSPAAKDIYRSFAGGRYWPRNEGIVTIDEASEKQPFPVDLPPKTGTLIVGCMKNEGPYILEWVAYHKAIGVDHFLIFTNDCSDGTDEILQRLMELGHLTHANNDEWKGKSPQQAALNKAMKMDVVKRAEWLIHIDVDEYINVRVGNGTMADLYAGMGDATNLAMTWRLFGNAGQEEIGEATVIDRFTGCAPAYVPKPHTMWGFKSITRNVGAYEKLSCHRPNHLASSHKPTVRWLNGNLQDHTKELADKGWRSSVQSIGYDAVQLNHYALRTRESFLIKRQRGRALHVDRSIGLNYWVRHDWHLNPDRTILRQVPRTWAMKAELLKDPVLAELQARALAWHHAKAKELRETEAFAELWDQTKQAELSDGERMAFAVAEDMDS